MLVEKQSMFVWSLIKLITNTDDKCSLARFKQYISFSLLKTVKILRHLWKKSTIPRYVFTITSNTQRYLEKSSEDLFAQRSSYQISNKISFHTLAARFIYMNQLISAHQKIHVNCSSLSMHSFLSMAIEGLAQHIRSVALEVLISLRSNLRVN